mmetsp:Transcript_6440/g.15895  ORF Transcript_6440/g.15895 Transcript_6440/m.15895 type:complete len:145 (-) Transcript_6440:207-641(-)
MALRSEGQANRRSASPFCACLPRGRPQSASDTGAIGREPSGRCFRCEPSGRCAACRMPRRERHGGATSADHFRAGDLVNVFGRTCCEWVEGQVTKVKDEMVTVEFRHQGKRYEKKVPCPTSAVMHMHVPEDEIVCNMLPPPRCR